MAEKAAKVDSFPSLSWGHRITLAPFQQTCNEK